MTDPVDNDDATDRWGLLFHSSLHYTPHHTLKEWARIADAIRTADRHTTDAKDGPVRRGDARWCRAALNTYDILDATGAYWHVDYGDQPVCAADEHIIRAWLNSPWIPAGDEPMTMLDANRLDLQFAPGHRPHHTSVIFLVQRAQDLGLFGAPDHRFGLYCWTENGEMRADAFAVTARTPDGARLTSPMITLADLVGAGDRPAADTVVGVLQGVARVANDFLDTHTRAAAPAAAPPRTRTAVAAPGPATITIAATAAAPPPTIGDGAFPPLRLDNPAALTPLPESGPPHPGRRR